MVITEVLRLRLDHFRLDERCARLDLRVVGHIGLIVDEFVRSLRRDILARGDRGTLADCIADCIAATPRDQAAIIDRTISQVRLIALGMAAWLPAEER